MTTKTTLLITLFVLGLLGGVNAQDKYEFAVISFSPPYMKEKIRISYDNKPLEVIEVSKDDYKDARDLTPALKQVAKMQETGWELFNTDIAGMGSTTDDTYYFYMRKKKN